MKVRLPLNATKQLESVNIRAISFGGGYSAQADAVKHGISKALIAYEERFRTILKPMGLLTRDSRVVERKKPGEKEGEKKPSILKKIVPNMTILFGSYFMITLLGFIHLILGGFSIP